jgi:long-chain fatty acid transport protein
MMYQDFDADDRAELLNATASQGKSFSKWKLSFDILSVNIRNCRIQPPGVTILVKHTICFLILLFVLTPGVNTTVFAGGIYITEFGQPSMGTSGAGWSILAEDASTGVGNPAGIFQLENDSEWMVSGLYVSPSTKFRAEPGTTIPGNDGGDAGVSAVGGSVFHARKLSDKWALGLGINSISAAAMDYEAGFVGRHWLDEIELLTVTASANVAYKVNDNFAVAVGLPMMFGSLDMDVAIPPLMGPVTPERDGLAQVSDGSDFSATLALGIYWELDSKTELSLTYLGENELKFGSDVAITLPGMGSGVMMDDISADVEIPFARALILSAAHDISDRTTLLATWHWEDWSTLDEVLISTSMGGVPLTYDWDDTYKLALGMRHRGSGPWTYYTGVAYDTDPTSADNRSADLPIDRQWRLSFGASYKLPSGKTVNGSLTYADYGDARIENMNGGGTVIGEYSTNRILFAGFSVNWH